MPRISDVAHLAGVSTATVSRALSAPDQVREETRGRVLTAVEALGYTPNAAARHLRAGTSRLVLVVIPRRSSPPFFSEVLHGIDAELSAQGYAVIMGNFDGETDPARRLVELVFANRLDGVIVLSGQTPAIAGRSIFDASLPIVTVCAEIAGVEAPAVLIDDAACAKAQARHLIELGHRRLLYVAGPEGNYNEIRRFKGFVESVREAGLPSGAVVRHPGNYMVSGGVAAGEAFLAMDPRPTGVACCNDEMAIGFVKKVRDAGLSIPRDVSVVGFDGIEVAAFIEPALTTIQQPRFELGAAGARSLLAQMKGGGGASWRTVLHGELLVRGSTGPAPGWHG